MTCWGCHNFIFQICLFLLFLCFVHVLNPLRNIWNHHALKKVIVYPYLLESHWLFFYELVIFLWDLGLKKHSYSATPLLRPSYNETSFAISIRSFWPHMSLPSYHHISSFDCLWLILLQSILKILSNSIIYNFSKSPCRFYRHIFLTLSALWFDSCKTFHACLAVIVLVTISKVASFRHW